MPDLHKHPDDEKEEVDPEQQSHRRGAEAGEEVCDRPRHVLDGKDPAHGQCAANHEHQACRLVRCRPDGAHQCMRRHGAIDHATNKKGIQNRYRRCLCRRHEATNDATDQKDRHEKGQQRIFACLEKRRNRSLDLGAWEIPPSHLRRNDQHVTDGHQDSGN